VRVEVPRNRHARVVGCVVLVRRQNPGTDQFGAAFELREDRSRRDLILAPRGNVHDLAHSVAITGKELLRLAANAELAVFAVDDRALSRAARPAPRRARRSLGGPAIDSRLKSTSTVRGGICQSSR
jgi:hypothetical protein